MNDNDWLTATVSPWLFLLDLWRNEYSFCFVCLEIYTGNQRENFGTDGRHLEKRRSDVASVLNKIPALKVV